MAKSLNIIFKQQMPRLTRTQNCPMLMVRVELLCLLLPLCTKVLLRLLEAFLSSECCSCCYFTLLINIKQSSAVYCHDDNTEYPISIFRRGSKLSFINFQGFWTPLLFSRFSLQEQKLSCTIWNSKELPNSNVSNSPFQTKPPSSFQPDSLNFHNVVVY